jgi:lipoprotein-releasing system ATP-binding protein
MSALVTCTDVSVRYGRGDAETSALRSVSVEVDEQDELALWGRSGSGKTTLLHVLGGLLAPTSGNVRWRGERLQLLDESARGRARPPRIAFVFQGSNLLPTLTARENVAFAARPVAAPDDLTDRAEESLALVGLAGKRDALPAELSGGERQRVAIARALAQEPELVLCDEPTGHLDSDTATRVLDLIDATRQRAGFALVVATHDPDVAARLDRRLELLDGELVQLETV